MRKRALRIRVVSDSKCKCASTALHFADGRIELRVYVLREEQRAMPAYEEPPVSPGGFLFSVSIYWLRRALSCAMIAKTVILEESV